MNSFPQVLVTQSMVGREGLNLHEACRTVILLPREWNPGAVEQLRERRDDLRAQPGNAVSIATVHEPQYAVQSAHPPREDSYRTSCIDVLLPFVNRGRIFRT